VPRTAAIFLYFCTLKVEGEAGLCSMNGQPSRGFINLFYSSTSLSIKYFFKVSCIPGEPDLIYEKYGEPSFLFIDE